MSETNEKNTGNDKLERPEDQKEVEDFSKPKKKVKVEAPEESDSEFSENEEEVKEEDYEIEDDGERSSLHSDHDDSFDLEDYLKFREQTSPARKPNEGTNKNGDNAEDEDDEEEDYASRRRRRTKPSSQSKKKEEKEN
eukprot:TRINITY_DN2287_c0_g1_i2.p1 TRINITY_DN2287_c0_g1~~TRINITY_DN2287_c0_g1_i2.p1  ORF type:complete len:138 (-),score=54.73 TRINITY_DN2287_c0_g1_i2:90-503(-)